MLTFLYVCVVLWEWKDNNPAFHLVCAREGDLSLICGSAASSQGKLSTWRDPSHMVAESILLSELFRESSLVSKLGPEFLQGSLSRSKAICIEMTICAQ